MAEARGGVAEKRPQTVGDPEEQRLLRAPAPAGTRRQRRPLLYGYRPTGEGREGERPPTLTGWGGGCKEARKALVGEPWLREPGLTHTGCWRCVGMGIKAALLPSAWEGERAEGVRPVTGPGKTLAPLVALKEKGYWILLYLGGKAH